MNSIEHHDGSVTLNLAPSRIIPNKTRHADNLVMPLIREGVNVTHMGYELKNAIEQDLQSREKWDKLLAEAIDLFGIYEKKRVKPFRGACGAYSYSFMHGVSQMVSFVSGECLPKLNCYSDAQDLSDAQTDFMNVAERKINKTVDDWTEYKEEKDQLWMWTCVSGIGYTKSYWDLPLNRPTVVSVDPRNMIVHDCANNLESAERYTYRFELTIREFQEQVRNGVYRDVNVRELNTDYGMSSLADERKEEADGIQKQSSRLEGDEIVRIYECYEYRKLPWDDRKVPYVTSINANTGEVLSIYRDWAEGDTTFQRLKVFTCYRLHPGTGFYGWGLMHFTGNLARSATAMHRQLIDAGTMSMSASGWYSGAGIKKDNVLNLEPMKWYPIESTEGTTIQQKLLQQVYPAPNPVVLQMKTELEQAIQQFTTILLSPSDVGNNMPVGTLFGYLDERQRQHRSIMGRLVASLNQECRILERLLKRYYMQQSLSDPEAAPIAQTLGTQIHIRSGADPRISSAFLRSLRSQTLMQMAQGAPQLHNLPAIYKHTYHVMGFTSEDINQFMVPTEQQPNPPLDPRTENMMMRQGQTVKAYKDQDHAAHRLVLQDLLADPFIQQNPQLWTIVKAHDDSHAFLEKVQIIEQQLGQPIPEEALGQLPIEIQNQIAALEAEEIQQQQQAMQEAQPPAPMDPSIPVLEDVRGRHQISQAHVELDKMKLELEKMRIELDAVNQNRKDQIKAQSDEQKAELDAQKLNLEAQKMIRGGA